MKLNLQKDHTHSKTNYNHRHGDSYLDHGCVVITMAKDHTHHLICEEVMREGVRGGGW